MRRFAVTSEESPAHRRAETLVQNGSLQVSEAAKTLALSRTGDRAQTRFSDQHPLDHGRQHHRKCKETPIARNPAPLEEQFRKRNFLHAWLLCSTIGSRRGEPLLAREHLTTPTTSRIGTMTDMKCQQGQPSHTKAPRGRRGRLRKAQDLAGPQRDQRNRQRQLPPDHPQARPGWPHHPQARHHALACPCPCSNRRAKDRSSPWLR